jgi:cyclopropane fatty-acyl-phospholipid synthase-like methyltransferase
MKLEELYTSGEYLEKWPTWHAEISPWQARQIRRMLERHDLAPKTICEVGCGAGGILKQLQAYMNEDCIFWGYEISPQAFELCQSRANERLHFKLADFTQEQGAFFDLILVIDVIEHVEDFFSFLRAIQPKSSYKILHIPLDMAAKTIVQGRVTTMLEEHGHIHYFTKDIALRMLKDIGYNVLDCFYTTPSVDLAANDAKGEIRRQLMRIPRKLLFAINNDLAARTLGGYSLMVLAQ